jgi:hypothetical protein
MEREERRKKEGRKRRGEGSLIIMQYEGRSEMTRYFPAAGLCLPNW